MVNKQTRKKVTIGVILIGVLLLAAGAGILINSLSKPDTTQEQTRETSADEANGASGESTKPQGDTSDSANNAAPTLAFDPATVGTIEVPSLALSVSYVKGVGAFEYEVLRTPSGTQYVEFRSAELVGTKCTNDLGAFASIIKNPSSNEDTSTIKSTVTLSDAKYGISLSGANCTPNTELLSEYQQSFESAFSLLKKTN